MRFGERDGDRETGVREPVAVALAPVVAFGMGLRSAASTADANCVPVPVADGVDFGVALATAFGDDAEGVGCGDGCDVGDGVEVGFATTAAEFALPDDLLLPTAG